MRITVNDHLIELPEHATLEALLTQLACPSAGHALAVNEAVIPRSSWMTHTLRPGDQVLLIQPMAGG